MEINNESKAKFFAQYMFQHILMWHDKSILYAVDGSDLAIVSTKKTDYFLLLKPLSSITDEDVIESGNLSAWISTVNEDISDYKDYVIVSGIKETKVYQYLQSKGYALPWMGLSVEEMVQAGWIKLTTP